MEIPKILKYTFIFHFIVSIVFGLWYFLSIESWAELTGWPFMDPTSGRVMGAQMIGFGFTSLLGYRAKSWDQVEIIVLGEIVWEVLAAIAMTWMMLVHTDIPPSGWFLVILLIVFVVLFGYSCYLAKRQA
ncbi:MAG: hypothetical protein ACFE7R_11140 [Candidatus Hodarchaeota archaeon]